MFDEPGDSAWTCRQLPEGVCHKAVVGTSQRRKHDESEPTSDKYTLEQTLLSDSMLAGIGRMGIQHVCDEPKCVQLMSQIHLNLRNHLGVSTCSIRPPNLVGQICSFCALTIIKSSDIQSIKNPLDHVVACVHLAVWTSWYLQQPVVQLHTPHNHQRTICPSDGSREIDLPKSCNQHLPFLLAVSCICIALKRMLVWRRT